MAARGAVIPPGEVALGTFYLDHRRARIREPRRGHIAHVRATLRGKRLKIRRRGGRLVAIVDLRGRARRTFTVRITVRTKGGRTYDDSRTYHPCRRS